MQRCSLAQQIAQLEDVAPIDFDPEDVRVTGIGPDSDLDIVPDNSTTRAHYFDVGPSSLRKLHDSLSDPKYDGSKTSRTLMLDESDGSEGDSNSVSEVVDAPEAHPMTHSSDRETEVQRETDTRPTANASTQQLSAYKQNNDLSSNLRQSREEDRKKGKAISRQITLWDSLLDARIRLQKSVAAGNRLPLASSRLFLTGSRLTKEQLPQDATNQQVHTPLVKMLAEARLLSNEIFEFQEHLLSANESIQPSPRKRRRSTETDYLLVDYVEELRESSRAVSELERAYHPHLVQTLNKWSSKIQAVAPSVLLPSNRNAFSRTTQDIKSAPRLIDETLADHGKVLTRTRIYRGKGGRLGVSGTDEDGTREKEDPQVFDDTDFYHQLLRDIIDVRRDGTGGNEDWMAVQKQRKAKKNVDTKASKGRKLRYDVHEKIQNFMMPVPIQGSWHEEQIDELFASLLGKGFEGAMQEAGETADEPLQEEVNAALQGGFRVFG